MIFQKDSIELSMMRSACRAAAIVLRKLMLQVVPGMTTAAIERMAIEEMRILGVESASYQYRKGIRLFPSHICTSVNHVVVHGIPSEDVVLKEGDVISIDVAVRKNGFYGDTAGTLIVGKGDEIANHLVRITESSLYMGIEKARAGNRIGDIASVIQKHIEENGFSLVRDFTGHGIGKELHEKPVIPNFGHPGTGEKLVEGMTLAIEPMVNEGKFKIKILPDEWTAVTDDGKRSAHFEHTVLITDGAPEILTTL
jgi:methionyl aminopeptidase